MYKKKVALNLEEIRGLISKLKLPTYQITDDTRSVELVVPTAEVDIEGLDQSEYLLCRTYFLMNLYCRYCIYDLQVIDEKMVLIRIDDLGFDCEKYHQPMIDRGQDEVAPYVVDMLPIDKL